MPADNDDALRRIGSRQGCDHICQFSGRCDANPGGLRPCIALDLQFAARFFGHAGKFVEKVQRGGIGPFRAGQRMPGRKSGKGSDGVFQPRFLYVLHNGERLRVAGRWRIFWRGIFGRGVNGAGGNCKKGHEKVRTAHDLFYTIRSRSFVILICRKIGA